MKRIKYISAKQKAKRKRRKTDAGAWIWHTLRKPAHTQKEFSLEPQGRRNIERFKSIREEKELYNIAGYGSSCKR